MINIRRMWQPLTATPFLATAAHHEIPPCESLQRWIRCFWGGIIGAGASPTRIIPDVCADLIYHIDETAGRIIQASFCGVSDVCGTAHLPLIPGHTVSTFAIRFHAFGAYAFADDALRGTLNGFESPEVRFGRLDRALRARLLELDGLTARGVCAERPAGVSVPGKSAGGDGGGCAAVPPRDGDGQRVGARVVHQQPSAGAPFGRVLGDDTEEGERAGAVSGALSGDLPRDAE